MDFTESTKVVYNRIQRIEPENVSKIIGYLLLQDHGEREMIRLAFSPDNLIYSLINKAKSDLGLNKHPVSAPISPSQMNLAPVSDIPVQFNPYSPASSRLVSSPTMLRSVSAYWDAQVSGEQQQSHNLDFGQPVYPESVGEDYQLQNQLQFLSLDDQLEFVNSVNSDFSSNYFYQEQALGPRASRRSPSLPEFPVKVCHYFIKGFCKHGNNCRYFHGHPMPESFSQIFSSNSNESSSEEHVSPQSLEKLELELTELLKSRRRMPVSIASLPMMYYEKYGRTLQAEGYLTESQRHGKAGYSLTKLLARLKNSIRLIDRPHGQHSVILAEDVPKYMEYAGDRNDPGGIVAGSRQIYLTFPAESTFTEQDVSDYFSKFGPVQDVRIPCQQKRMFGFVTFVFAETVRQILAKGNPHFVCGARVLVKPYREKSRFLDRKYADKIQHPNNFSLHFTDGDSEFNSVPRSCENSRLFRKQLLEEHEQAFEFERRRFSEPQLAPKPLSHHSHFGYSMDELKFSEDQGDFPSAERFNYLLDVLNNGSTSEDKLRHINTKYHEQDSQGLNLPESPFAAPIGSGISTVI
uniref:Zinc finger CCCH domain-containing protein 18 isoform X4 n=1 Tax=Rhizophora mucronata TaxID=61149 RepID=A0A2P2JL63_RHIMU